MIHHRDTEARREDENCRGLCLQHTHGASFSLCLCDSVVKRSLMGLYNFKKRFAPFVADGSKRHTIRARRKHPTKVGDTVHLYTGLRQKGARLLGRSVCIKIEEIQISLAQQVFVDGVELSLDEKNALAFCDGFRSFGVTRAFEEMMAFWNGRLPFEGDIIHWKEISHQQSAFGHQRKPRRAA